MVQGVGGDGPVGGEEGRAQPVYGGLKNRGKFQDCGKDCRCYWK